MENNDISKYIDMLVRRKYWLIISFMVTFLAGIAYLLNTPKIYKASTLILVQPQEVPKDYVQPLVTTDIDDRLRTITQQVTSRTNLTNIIRDYHLYDSAEDQGMLIEDKVKKIRENIKIDIAYSGSRDKGANAFSISFEGQDPGKVMQVTNALASNFITENLKMRESQAIGTSDFLADELDSLKDKLKKKEAEVAAYKEKYMGGLPEQLQTNLSIIQRLQGQLDQLNSNLQAAEDRKLILQENLSVTPQLGGAVVTSHAQSSPGGEETLPALKNQLASLLTRYTDKYPDVVSLKKRIATLEKEEKSEKNVSHDSASKKEPNPSNSSMLAVNPLLNDANVQIEKVKTEIEQVTKQIKWYETKVEETPKREQQMESLNRDYKNLKAQYDAMLTRKLEASMAVSMEKRQKGEQFKVVDPANRPQRPVKPNVKKIMLLTIVLGLGIGCGLIYLKEFLDTSYKTPEDAEKELSVPVLISIPFLMTPKEIKRKKNKNIIIAVSICACFIIALAGIVMSAKGLGQTLNLIKEIFINI